ncbi:unnamed protein product [Lymnaea stagnalis]|uniref:USP domain-containing protein n=1 Tax=Lymnaea stagnalis TaxID=6523 RepID=A0AAV2I892_LYMST
MFEGHFQHDAQELLRCLLCYVEDAEKEVLRAKDRIKTNNTLVTVPNPFCCDRSLTDGSGAHQPKGDAQGEVTLKGGDSRRKDPGKEMKRGRGRSTSSALTPRHLNDDSKNLAVCEVNNLSNPVPSPNPGLEIESVLVGDTKINLLTSAPSSKQKRKRSRSGSQGKSDQPSSSPTLNSPRAGSVTHNTIVKVNSVVSLRNGSIVKFMRSVDNGNSELKENPVESRAEGRPSLQEKVTTLSHKSKSSVHQSAVTSQPSLNPIFPFSEMKCLAVRGNTDILSHALPMTSGQHFSNGDSTNGGEKSLNNNIDRCGDDNNNNENDCETNKKGNDLLNDSADLPIEIVSDGDSPKPSELPVKKLRPVTSSPTKLYVYSPSKSPRMVEVVDEISIVPECSSSFFESAIDSVTKKYFSSLSPARVQTSPPSKPALPDVGHFTPDTQTFPSIKLIVEEPTGDASTENKSASSESPNFLEEMHVTVHSHNKVSDDDRGLASPKTPGRDLTPMHSSASGSEEVGEAVAQSLRASTNPESTVDETARLLHLSSDGSHTTSPGYDSMQKVPQRGMRNKKQSLSAPSTPVSSVFSSQMKNLCGFACDVQDKSLTCKISRELQLRLKKCDWLGVSPVKSVSAKEALSVLTLSRPRGAVGTTAAVRRNIFQNDDDGSFSKNVVQSPWQQKQDVMQTPQQQNKNVVPSLQQQNKDMVQTLRQNHPKLVDIKSEPSEENSYHCADNAGSSSRNSARKRKEYSSINSLTVSLRSRKRKSQPNETDSDRKSHTQVEPLKKDSCPIDLVGFSKGSLLKKLSVSLDNCDWLLLPGAGSKVSAKQAMVDMKKCVAARRSRGERQFSTKTLVSEQIKAANSDDVTRPKTNTLVDHLFGGTMMHRTKCLECEKAKERQEVFMDISIPVRSLHAGDVDSDEEGGGNAGDVGKKSEDSCLDKLMQALSNIERLKDNNKYFCEECIHYVEAERSCHYTTLPLVLTLHLKRFGSVSGRFGGVSKLNDKVEIPQHLPCLQYNCKNTCTDPTHRYSLFAIVTHSGMSVLHGHYRSYVKIQPLVSPEVFANLCKMTLKSEPVMGDVQGVLPDSKIHPPETDTTSHSPRRTNANFNKHIKNERKQEVKLEESDALLSSGSGETSSAEQLKGVSNSRDTQSPGANDLSSQAGWDCFWLECDDECIRVLEEEEFMEKLEERDGALMGTPYILFYHKMVLT